LKAISGDSIKSLKKQEEQEKLLKEAQAKER
jgi:hypothetical protein